MRDFNAKWRQATGLSVCMECEMPKITIGIAGLRENLGQDVVIGMENPFGEPLLIIGYSRQRVFRLHSSITDVQGMNFTMCIMCS